MGNFFHTIQFKTFVIFVTVGLLVGCALLPTPLPPPQPILLDPIICQTTQRQKTAPGMANLWVDTVTVPSFLNTQNVFIKIPPGVLEVYQGTVWAMPPEEVFKNWINQGFLNQKSFQHIYHEFNPTQKNMWKLNINLHAFWVLKSRQDTFRIEIKTTLILTPLNQMSSQALMTQLNIDVPIVCESIPQLCQGFQKAMGLWTQQAVDWVNQIRP